MDAQDFRSLQEAYMEVYQLDEEERPIYGRGGGLRRTQTPLQVLGKHATARDKRTKRNIPKGGTTIDTGDSSKLFSGDYDQGKGSKAARRAAALKKPKKSFPNRLRRSDGQGIQDSYDYHDIILSHLLDEGYAETQEAAEVIMVNMTEEWRESIIEAEIQPPMERVGALTNIDFSPEEREAARKRTLAKAAKAREKKKNP